MAFTCHHSLEKVDCFLTIFNIGDAFPQSSLREVITDDLLVFDVVIHHQYLTFFHTSTGFNSLVKEGRLMRNVEPSLSTEWAVMSPPCNSTIFLHADKPMPVPGYLSFVFSL